MGLIGPEVADAKALNIPLDQAEILVTEQGGRGQGAEGVPQRGFRRPAAGGADRARRRADPARARRRSSSASTCCSWPASRAPSTRSAAKLGKVARAEHGDRPADAVGGHGAGPAHRPDQRSDSATSRWASAMRAACCSRASSSPRSCRGCASSATRRTRRATSSRTSAWSPSSPSSASTPAPRCSRSSPARSRSRSSWSASSPARFRRSSRGPSATTSSRSTRPC